MTKVGKSLNKFILNPSSFHFLKIEALLLTLGFEKVQAKGSHVKFKHSLINNDLIIPLHNNDCKDFYKKMIVKILKQNKII